jgi:hypothetical protein
MGTSVLGIVSRGDIVYANDGPNNLEINASLISMEGKVCYEGINVSADGKTVTVDSSTIGNVKGSIRRLGGIVAKHRPVTTFVDENNKVLAGYDTGMSFMDRNMILKAGGNVSPPFIFYVNQPLHALKSVGKVFIPKTN